jgi:hypothetical protein
MISSKSKEILFLQKLDQEKKLNPEERRKMLDDRLKQVVDDMKAKRAKEREEDLKKWGYYV